jgi:hypothetical protein
LLALFIYQGPGSDITPDQRASKGRGGSEGTYCGSLLHQQSFGVKNQAALTTHDPQVRDVELGSHLGASPILRSTPSLLIHRPKLAGTTPGAIEFSAEQSWVISLAPQRWMVGFLDLLGAKRLRKDALSVSGEIGNSPSINFIKEDL